jgi:hypothetical protein
VRVFEAGDGHSALLPDSPPPSRVPGTWDPIPSPAPGKRAHRVSMAMVMVKEGDCPYPSPYRDSRLRSLYPRIPYRTPVEFPLDWIGAWIEAGMWPGTWLGRSGMEKLQEAGALREENENLEDTHGFEVVGTDQLGPADGRRMSGPPALSSPVGSRAGRDRDTQGPPPTGIVMPCMAMHSIAMLCNRLGRMAPSGEDPIRRVPVAFRVLASRPSAEATS